MPNKVSLKILLVGYGKMGKMVEKAARAAGHEVIAIVDPTYSALTLDHALAKADIAIDFSHASAVLKTLERAIHHKKNLVMGTTGWYDEMAKVKEMVDYGKIGFLYAPNFSIGVNLFLKIVEEASQLFSSRPEYEAAGFEIHHSQKLDSPSGTALAMRNAVSRSRWKDLPLSSLRVGKVPGTHTFLLDSDYDTIEITHTARSREGFALGAVAAASYLYGKVGFYTFKEILHEI